MSLFTRLQSRWSTLPALAQFAIVGIVAAILALVVWNLAHLGAFWLVVGWIVALVVVVVGFAQRAGTSPPRPKNWWLIGGGVWTGAMLLATLGWFGVHRHLPSASQVQNALPAVSVPTVPGTSLQVFACVALVVLGVLALIRRTRPAAVIGAAVLAFCGLLMVSAGWLGSGVSASAVETVDQNPGLPGFAAYVSWANAKDPAHPVTPKMYREFLATGADADKAAVHDKQEQLLADFGLRLTDGRLIAVTETGIANLRDLTTAMP